MNSLEKLQLKNINKKFVCIGLDTDPEKIPVHLKKINNPVLEFNRQIIENTSKYAAAYKFNFAFYERYGSSGFDILKKSIELIPGDILIIGDAKRGDIGNTSKMYASAIFDYFKCDASTLHPYMGEDSISPFLSDETKLNFILALTSNPGAEDFEKLKLSNGKYLFQEVIEKVKSWNKKGNCGIVFGATKPLELSENIKNFGELPVLLPGVGAQGGSFPDVVKIFHLNKRNNFLVNVSRSVIYKSTAEDFAEAAGNEVSSMNFEAKNILI